MAASIKFAPPFLKKLAALDSPLVDDGEIQEELIRMRLEAEREERQARGDLFAGPVVTDRPKPQDRSLPFPELSADVPTRDPLRRPVAAPVESPPIEPPLPNGLAGLIAPPDAPPPPLPADRPPGMFRFEEAADA